MSITAKNKANEREVEMMVGKAMCAYANWQNTLNIIKKYGENSYEYRVHERMAGILASEYEATCRCIAMFTVEHLPEVCQTIIDRAKSEFGI